MDLGDLVGMEKELNASKFNPGQLLNGAAFEGNKEFDWPKYDIDDEYKIKYGDYKKKVDGDEVKIKDGDTKIKIEDGEKKVKKDD